MTYNERFRAKVNPSCPIIYLQIGSTVLTTENKPRQADNIISFSMTESPYNTYTDIVFTLYDESALVLEYELKRGYTNVKYRFGADINSMCSMRVCHIVDYDIEFEAEGVTLTLNCQMGHIEMTGEGKTSDEFTKEFKGKISDVVKSVCKELGYKEGNIVETNDTPPETPYTSTGGDLIGLVESLATKAQDLQGNSGFVVYTKDQDGSVYLYFEPLLNTSTDNCKTYEFTLGEDHENILSFKPEYKGLLQYAVTPPSSSNIQDSSTKGADSNNPNYSSSESASTFVKENFNENIPNYEYDDKEVTKPPNDSYSPLKGTYLYRKNDKLTVYTGTSTSCNTVQVLVSNQWFIVYSETTAWYYGKTVSGRLGWVRKVDTSLWEPSTKKAPVEEKKEEQGTTTNPDDYLTSTGVNSGVDQDTLNKLGLLAPSVDELTNVLIEPYKSNTNFKRYIGSSSYNSEELGRIAEYMFTMASALQPTAQLELRGNALIDTRSMIIMVVMTKDKLFHHSSGLYQIIEVAHNIDMGEFTTTLNLIKRAMTIGEDGKISLLDVNKGVVSNRLTGTGTSNDTNTDNSGLPGGTLTSADIKKYAEKYIGLPYKWGGSGPNKSGYDCSGFCSEMLYDMGYKRIGTTANFINCEPVVPWDKSQIQPGDCMVYRQNGAGHVVMIVDAETIVHAPRTGDVIKYASIDYHWEYMQKKNGKIVRILGVDTYKRT